MKQDGKTMNKSREAKNDRNDPFPSRLRKELGVNDEDIEKDTSRGKFKELAESIGVSTAAISNYAKGTTGVSVDNLIKIAKKFHVSTDYLLGLSDARTNVIEEAAMQKYAGLSAESIKALHFLNSGFHRLPYIRNHDAYASLAFINRVLEDCWFEIEIGDNFTGETIFCHLENWVTGSGDSGDIELDNGRIRKDDAYRTIELQKAREFLEKYSELDGTFRETLEKTERERDEKEEQRRQEERWEEEEADTAED